MSVSGRLRSKLIKDRRPELIFITKAMSVSTMENPLGSGVEKVNLLVKRNQNKNNKALEINRDLCLERTLSPLFLIERAIHVANPSYQSSFLKLCKDVINSLRQVTRASCYTITGKIEEENYENYVIQDET